MIKYTDKNQVREGRACFGLQFQSDKLRNGRDGMAAEGKEPFSHSREGITIEGIGVIVVRKARLQKG